MKDKGIGIMILFKKEKKKEMVKTLNKILKRSNDGRCRVYYDFCGEVSSKCCKARIMTISWCEGNGRTSMYMCSKCGKDADLKYIMDKVEYKPNKI